MKTGFFAFSALTRILDREGDFMNSKFPFGFILEDEPDDFSPDLQEKQKAQANIRYMIYGFLKIDNCSCISTSFF